LHREQTWVWAGQVPHWWSPFCNHTPSPTMNDAVIQLSARLAVRAVQGARFLHSALAGVLIRTPPPRKFKTTHQSSTSSTSSSHVRREALAVPSDLPSPDGRTVAALARTASNDGGRRCVSRASAAICSGPSPDLHLLGFWNLCPVTEPARGEETGLQTERRASIFPEPCLQRAMLPPCISFSAFPAQQIVDCMSTPLGIEALQGHTQTSQGHN
jgi:hypothetical protein